MRNTVCHVTFVFLFVWTEQVGTDMKPPLRGQGTLTCWLTHSSEEDDDEKGLELFCDENEATPAKNRSKIIRTMTMMMNMLPADRHTYELPR